MALSFNDSALRGISYDGDPGTFDGPEWVYIDASGFATAEAFGSPQLNQGITGTGVVSGEAFGVLQMFLDFNIIPFGVVSAEAFGTSQVAVAWPIQIDAGITSEEVFGDARPSLGLLSSGISTGEVFGTLEASVQWEPDEAPLTSNWVDGSGRFDTWTPEASKETTWN